MNDLNECCGASPIVYMPMWWGNKQIDESLTPHVECRKCGRVCHGKTPDQAYDNWNSTNEKTPKDAYKEFDKQTKRDLEEAEIRNCPVRGPILKQIDEAISRSRKEFVDSFIRPIPRKEFDIKSYEFDDPILSVSESSKEAIAFHCYTRESVTFTREDWIAGAKHFKLTAEDLK